MKSGEERELNPKVKNLRSIGWYPDGRFLVLFGRDMQDRFAIFKMDTTTGNATLLYNLFKVNGLNVNLNYEAPSVAPDGRTFYQTASNWTSNAMIFALNSETKEFRKIFQPGRMTLGFSAISPDGQHVAATFLEEGGSKRSGLLVVNSHTGAMRELCETTTKVDVPIADKQASVAGWTPDSRNVVMVTTGNDPKTNEVWRVPLDGGPPQKSRVPGITLRAHSSGNRLAWTTGDTNLTTEIWALDNALPRE
jgi:WD40 repeat protein